MEKKLEQKRFDVTAEAASLAIDTIMSYIKRKLPKDEQIIAILNTSIILSADIICAAINVGGDKNEVEDIYIQLLKDCVEEMTKKD